MREATTRFVILGLLDSEGPLSGYEIRQTVAESIGFFWAESFGQLYPELKRLAAEKLIAPAEDRPAARDRRRFRITAGGRQALRTWLAKPARPQPVRIEYLLKLFFGRQAGVAACRQILAGVYHEQQLRLRALGAAYQELAGDRRQPPPLVFWLIVLRAGILAARMRLAWAEESRLLLDSWERGGASAMLATLRRIEKT
jgi:DNA-binding PadR family transcriptional regulator